MGHDVFVSYASGDKPVADAVCAKLEANGVRCWIAPRDVIPGVHYGEAIIDAIHECRIMVLVFSSKANLSGHIPKEIERAVSAGITVMPLRIEDVTPAKSLDYFIGSVHWLDALTPPLEAHLQRLTANVQTLLSRSAAGSDARGQPPSPPQSFPVTPATATHREPLTAKKPVWNHGVIGGLITIVLVLGGLLFWFHSQGRVATSKTPTQTVTAMQSDAELAPVPTTTAALPPKKVTSPANSSAGKNRVLRYVSGSTVKLEQLIGDEDKERHQPTRNQTVTRYGLQGTDLGYSFEHQGLAYFLFGSTVGRFPRALGAIARTDASDPDSGVKLDFLTSGKSYLGVESSDEQRPTRRVTRSDIQVPVSGISLGGHMYVVVTFSHPLDRTSDRSELTKFNAPATFQTLRTISQLPNGRFIKMSMHSQTAAIPGLPPGGPYILLWGTGLYRKSDAYLSITPAAEFESGNGTRYFTGLDAAGSPRWSAKETDAKPVLANGNLGDLSVAWSKDLDLWLMTYDSREPTSGILFSYSRTPWGPWSDPQILFNAARDGALGKFIHSPLAKPDDGLEGPVLGPKNQANPAAVRGAVYAPYVVERWAKVQGYELDLYYVMSTFNPYVVVLMKSRMEIE